LTFAIIRHSSLLGGGIISSLLSDTYKAQFFEAVFDQWFGGTASGGTMGFTFEVWDVSQRHAVAFG
jgi:hypothetical protein